MDIQIKQAEFVLIICSERYWHRVNGSEENGGGLGVYWESTLTYNHIYFDRHRMNRFIPVLFNRNDLKYVPTPLKGFSPYCVDIKKEAEKLYRRLTHQHPIQKSELGRERESIPTDPKPGKFADTLVHLVKKAYEAESKVTVVSPAAPVSTVIQKPIKKEKRGNKKDHIFTTVREMLKDKYDFKKGLIATGTYSRVYRAHHNFFNEDHVLKIMNFNLILDSIPGTGIKNIKSAIEKKKKEFEQEARFFKAFKGNPNILDLELLAYVNYEYRKEVLKIPYLITKYIKGVNLKEFIRKKGPLEWKRIFYISEQILSAIAAIHQQGFFYWNVRPEKIIIRDRSHTPVLLDADMPEHISSLTDLSGTNVLINKDLYSALSYLSPFIAGTRTRVKEKASLICLFGVLLYEMVTKDIDRRDEFGFFKNLSNKLNAPGFKLKNSPAWHNGIVNIIKKAIAQKPGQRYRNVNEVLDDLRAINPK
jgi:hypothetical protein